MRPADPDVPAEVGRRITALRRVAGLSLSELARRAGLGKGTLSALEAGHRNPTLETLYALTAPLGVGLATMIDLGRADGPARGSVAGDGVEAVLLDVIGGSEEPAITEVYRLTIESGARRVSPAHGRGVREQLTGVSGESIVGRLGSPQSVSPGQTVTWVSDTSHAFEAVGNRPSISVLVITVASQVIVTASGGAGDRYRSGVISLED